MNNTSISWTDRTWNPVRGCSRISPGCGGPRGAGGCYAEVIAARFSGPGQAFEGYATRSPAHWTGRVDLLPEKLAEPLRLRTPQRIFVNSTSDLFHEKLSDLDIAAVFGVMAAAPRHTFQILTKRAERMREWFRGGWRTVGSFREHAFYAARDRGVELPGDPWSRKWDGKAPPNNVWLGVSIEDQKTADERIPMLLQTPAALRFVSYEPALGPVDLANISAPTGEQWNVLDREEALDAAAEGGVSTRSDAIRLARNFGPLIALLDPDTVRELVRGYGALDVLRRALPYFEDIWDEGPLGEGWQSDELSRLVGEAQGLTSEPVSILGIATAREIMERAASVPMPSPEPAAAPAPLKYPKSETRRPTLWQGLTISINASSPEHAEFARAWFEALLTGGFVPRRFGEKQPNNEESVLLLDGPDSWEAVWYLQSGHEGPAWESEEFYRRALPSDLWLPMPPGVEG